MRRLVLLPLLVALAACGGGDEPAAPRAAGAPIPGGGLSVAEAKESELDGPLMVKGYLIEREGELRLCEAILESYPPQCGEPSLRIEGDPSQLEGAARDELVSMLGEVDGDAIRLSSTSR